MTGTDERAGPPTSGALALSIVIPAFNEALRLHDGMARLREAVAAGAVDPEVTEFIVVDDGSSDDTAGQAATCLAELPHVRVLRLPENRGKGAAVRAGVAAATGRAIVFADADMAIDPAQTPEFLAALTGADLAIGTRAASESSVDRGSIRRSVMNRLFNRLVNMLTRVSLDDTQCGYKAFRAPAAKLLFHCSATERFAFDVEILSLARHLGLSIAEVPVRWRRVKGSRIRPWADVGPMARDVLRAGRSLSSAPPVDALSVKLPPAASLEGPVRSVLAPPWVPVLERPDGTVLVLCPLMDGSEIESLASRVLHAVPDAVIERSTMTVTQLCQLAPLSLTWGDGSGDT